MVSPSGITVDQFSTKLRPRPTHGVGMGGTGVGVGAGAGGGAVSMGGGFSLQSDGAGVDPSAGGGAAEVCAVLACNARVTIHPPGKSSGIGIAAYSLWWGVTPTARVEAEAGGAIQHRARFVPGNPVVITIPRHTVIPSNASFLLACVAVVWDLCWLCLCRCMFVGWRGHVLDSTCIEQVCARFCQQ